MRILIAPTYEVPHLLADSSYTLMRSFVRAALDHDPNLFFYWLMPSESDRKLFTWKYDPKDLYTHPRLKYEFLPISLWRDFNEMLFSTELLDIVNPFFGKLAYYDAIITNNAGKAANLLHILEFLNEPIPKVYIWEFTPKLPSVSPLAAESLMGAHKNYAANANTNAYTLFQSEWCRKQLIKSARDYLSPKALNRILEQSEVFTGAVDFTGLDKVINKLNGKKFPKTTLYFGGRFSNLKRGDFITEIYDYAYCLGGDLDIRITTPTAQNGRVAKAKQEAAEIIIHDKMSQEDAWEIMAQSHISICAEKYFAYLPSSVMERISAGLVVLIFDSAVDGVFGPHKYPFLYKNKTEALTLLKEIITDLPAAQAKMQEVAEYVRNTYSIQKQVPALLNTIRTNVESVEYMYFPKKINKMDMFAELAKLIIRDCPARDWDSVWEFTIKHIATLGIVADVPLMPAIRRSKHQLYKMLKVRLGDDCNYPTPYFYGDRVKTLKGYDDSPAIKEKVLEVIEENS